MKLIVRSGALVACLACLLSHSGCGSSATDASGITLTLPSDPALDGFVTNDGQAIATGAGPAVGDTDAILPGRAGRQFFSFQIAGVPTTAEIVSATLRLYQAGVDGDPFGSLGSLVVDRVDLGDALDASDYDRPALQAEIGLLPTEVTLGYKALDVTAAVQAERASGRTRLQLRLRFSQRDGDHDTQNDLVAFSDAELSCCQVQEPSQLVVVFRP